MAISKSTLLNVLGSFKGLQDEANNGKFLGLHAKADSATTADGADVLNTARTINGVSFDGSENITINAEDSTARIAASEKGAANGVATLNESGLVPAAQLPSYVDDIIEGYYDEATGKFYQEQAKTTEITGETGKIYVDLAAEVDGQYRWSGSAFVAVGSHVSTADAAVNDADGNPIKTTYQKAEAGKGLSTEDFTTAEKQQLAALEAAKNETVSNEEIAALFA